MLSYQHGYHAGSLADLHKHRILSEVLAGLCRRPRPVAYYETHAGRALYDLTSPEATKTGEAEEGWLKMAQNEEEINALPMEYVTAVRRINAGSLAPLYPGSPKLAAHILRPHDRLFLFELHPKEHASLAGSMENDRRVSIYRRDGYEGVLSLVPPPRKKGLVLVDPSYEIKTEYEQAAGFAVSLLEKWPEASILIWYPLLPAGRHQTLVDRVKGSFPEGRVAIEEARWSHPSKGRGMYGSGIVKIGCD